MRAPLTLALTLLFTLPALAQITATRLDGHRISLFSLHAKIAVLFFVATDCPISNRYQPEILRLQRKFAPRSVALWLVYPNRTETPASIRAHRAAFAPEEPTTHILLDPNLALVHLTRATTTPEAAILSSTGALLYSGRIDDLYLSIGNSRAQPTHHDLEDAISAAITNRPVPPPSGPPVGCSIVTIQ